LVLDVSARFSARCVDREVLMAQNSFVQSCDPSFAEPMISAPDRPVPAPARDDIIPLLIGSTIDHVERELVLHTLVRCNGNRTRAARMLGLSIRTLRNKIRLYTADGIDVPAHCD
jgi:DNA-binding NtrC family response regulator